MKSITICVVCILLGASIAGAQLPTGTILGQVKDASGAAVAGARITARNTDTNQSRSTVTNEEGAYRLDGMPVGNYQISTEKEGFRSVVQSGLNLTVAQEASVNFNLEVGATSQTVEVTAEAPLVSTTTSSLGGLVDEERIADLPLNGRNYNDLTLLQPGVTQSTTSNSTSIGWSGTQYSSNGAPIRSNTYLLDGALLTNLVGTSGSSAIGTTLGVDGILEYRVITNAFNAEYGLTMGSQMTIVSKSGANQFHGDVFEYLRNSALDARNFFDLSPAKLGRRLPEFRRNNFGGSIGGPIQKDKTFFFAVYEGLRSSLGTTNTANTLAAGCHGNAGDSIWNGSTGGGTTQPAGSIGNCPQLGGSTASATTISPVMAPFVALYPIPNIASSTPQYGFVFVQPTTEDYGQVRVDHTISTSDSFFSRYTIDQSSLLAAGSFSQSQTIQASRNQFFTLAENHIFSTTLLNSARFSFSRTPLKLDNPITDATITGPNYSFVTGQPMGSLAVGGLTSLGTSSTAPRAFVQNIYTWSDDLDYSRGNHSLKFGFILNHYQDYILTRGYDKGVVSISNVANFFTGALTSYQEVIPGGTLERNWRFDTMGFYAQDSWRITPRLTLNLGMRYEPTTTYSEVHGISASLRNYLTDKTLTVGPPFRNPSLKNFSPRFGFAWDVFGDGKTAVRGGFGVLYDLATYGSELMNAAGYDPPFSTVFVTPVGAGGTLTALPYPTPAQGTFLSSYRGPVYFMDQPHLLQYNLAVERQLPGSMSVTVAYAGSRGLNLLQVRQGNATLPYGIPQTVGGVESCAKQLVGTAINLASQVDGVATSCFTATSSTNGSTYQNVNFPQIISDPAQGSSLYNSLQVGVTKRLAKGLQFQSSYTYSKLLDNTQGGAGQDVADFGTDMLHASERAPAAFDVAQNWRFNALYHLPDFASATSHLGKLTNGWGVSGIVAIQTGYPFNVTLSSQRSLSDLGFGSDHPNLVAGRSAGSIISGASAGCGTGNTRAQGGTAIAGGTALGTPNLWYDPCAFFVQPQGFLGNLPRNFLRGPGLTNVDFSIVKDTAARFLGESGKVEFRAEMFNVLNHANFAQPGTAAYGGCPIGVTAACGPSTSVAQNPTTSAGVISATRTTSRQIQFALKLLF